MDIANILVDEFQLKTYQVKNTIKLIDEGNTIPFIARYRKEQTGGLTDPVLRELVQRLAYLRNLEKRQVEIIKLIEEQGKMTGDLKKEILAAKTLQRLEDLYRPYRPKRRTRATIAKEKGLEGLAKTILLQEVKKGELEKEALKYINEEKAVQTIEDALDGAMDILAEFFSDNAEYRDLIRQIAYNKGIIEVIGNKEEKSEYEMYYEYREPVKSIANHRVLAINRGEKEKFLKVNLTLPDEEIILKLKSLIIKNDLSEAKTYLEKSLEDSYKRLIFPSIDREIRSKLTEKAENEAIQVFAFNLKHLLMQPPIRGKVVLGIDPGFRTGCKVAVIDDTGKLLSYTTVYPTEPRNEVRETKEELKRLINEYNVDIIAIGNGTASRETEIVVAETIKEISRQISYIIVSEAGASVYSASQVGNEEFPDLDVSIRGAISIGRRLQDPLAELVKIDPKHIGVGQYQHDLNQGKLGEALAAVVEDCVNTVGVDLNTASPSLLSYVAGISKRVAHNLVEHRNQIGRYRTREELLDVKGLGPKTFIQCAGFLRIADGDNPLDNTGVHPESYEIAEKLLNMEFKNMGVEKLAKELNIGTPTLQDIIKELEKPGRDPRDEMPKPIFRTDILQLEDLKEDMVLTGTVRNVVDFGAFVDIGVNQDGLVHISHLADKYVRHPKEIVKVGDIVKVRVLSVDKERGRISLSMKNM